MVFTSAYRASYATGSAVVPCDPPWHTHPTLGPARTCTRPPAAAAPLAAQAAAGFSLASFWAARGRGQRTAAAPTKTHAAGLIPGLCTRGLASGDPHIRI